MLLPLLLSAASLDVPFVSQHKDTCGAASLPLLCDTRSMNLLTPTYRRYDWALELYRGAAVWAVSFVARH